MKTQFVDVEHLLLALLKDKEGVAAQILAAFGVTTRLLEETLAVLEGKTTVVRKREKVKPLSGPLWSRFDAIAREGKLDPCHWSSERDRARDSDLESPQKNNPILIGDPGVGKTAIVEGLAQCIIEKRVPQILLDKRLVTLDMGGVVAGTKYRGQFEERIKAVMNELQQNTEVIIFIDELLPLLEQAVRKVRLTPLICSSRRLRGELQCIGATTLDDRKAH